jgi:hypothetical protein
MLKPNCCLYLQTFHPVFNKECIPVFGELDAEHSLQLYTSLVLNHKENLDKISEQCSVIYSFDEKDAEFLPEKFQGIKENIIYTVTSNPHSSVKILFDKYFPEYDNNLVIYADSIGNSGEGLTRVLDLISIESDAVAIGKSMNGGVSFVGFNNLNLELLQDINWDDMIYENLLRKVNRYDNFLYVLNDSLTIKSVQDFRTLYSELSKKESLKYCSQEMHERFTHLFIEYKDLLR